MSAQTSTEGRRIESEPGGTVRRAALWSGANTLLLKVANIGITAIVVRLVSPAEFGVFAVAMTVYAVISSMSELGVVAVLTRHDTDFDDIAGTVGTIAGLTGTLLALGMAAAAPLLGPALGSPQAASAIQVMSIAVFLVGIFAVPCASLAREFRQDRIFYANALAFVPTNALLIVLAKFGDGAMAFAWSRVLGQLLVGACLTCWASRHFAFGFGWRQCRQVLGIGLPLAGSNLVGYVLLNADFALIGRGLGPTRLGIYVLAFNVAGWSTSLLGSMINSVAMPAFSRVQADAPRLADAIARTCRTIASVAFPISAVTFALAGPIVDVLYGARWLPAAHVLRILALYGALFIVSLIFANALAGTARQAQILLLVQVAWLCALVPAMLFGLHLWGVRGVALAHVIVMCLVVIPGYLLAMHGLCRVRATSIIRAVAPAAGGALAVGSAAAVAAGPFALPIARLAAGLVAAGVLWLVLNLGKLDRLPMPARLRTGPYAAAMRVTSRLPHPAQLVGQRNRSGLMAPSVNDER